MIFEINEGPDGRLFGRASPGGGKSGAELPAKAWTSGHLGR